MGRYNNYILFDIENIPYLLVYYSTSFEWSIDFYLDNYQLIMYFLYMHLLHPSITMYSRGVMVKAVES